MFRRRNERGFDIWLLLLRDFDGNASGVVNTNYEALADSLGLLKDMDRRTYRGEISRKLRGLNKLYKLVEIDTKYDPREFEQNLKHLEDVYGKELITKSREYAFVVFKGYDLNVIEMTASFISTYGPAKVDEAFKIVGMKDPDNPKRTFGYVTGILGKMK